MQAHSLPLPKARARRGARVPPILLAALAQGLALACVALLLVFLPRGPATAAVALLTQSVLAMCFSFLFRMRPWWLLLQALCVPAVLLASSLQLPSLWYLLAFAFLVLIYGTTFKSQVPLYLSRPQVWHAVLQALPQQRGLRFADLGSGLGGLLAYLAEQRGDMQVSGIEAAPLPAWIAKLRNYFRRNVAAHWGDFWRRDLSEFDVVFAYLSPVAMPALWQKARQEMRPGSLFISYRFEVPGVAASQEIVLDDLGRTRLYLWQM